MPHLRVSAFRCTRFATSCERHMLLQTHALKEHRERGTDRVIWQIVSDGKAKFTKTICRIVFTH